MKHLNFATLAKLIGNSIGLTNEKTVRLLFTISERSLKEQSLKNADVIYIDKSDVSKLMNNSINLRRPNRDLPQIKQIPYYINNFKDQIVSNLPIDKAESLALKLTNLIQNDRRIMKIKKEELLKKSTSSLEEFLAYTYLTVLQLPNKLPDFENTTLSEILSFEFPYNRIGPSFYYSLIIDQNFKLDNFSYNKNITKMSVISNNELLLNTSEVTKDTVRKEFISDYNRFFDIPIIVGNTNHSNDKYLYLAGLTDFTFEEYAMDFEYEIITPIERSIFLDKKRKDYNSPLAEQIGIIDRLGGYGQYKNNGKPVFELNNPQWNVKRINLAQKLQRFGY